MATTRRWIVSGACTLAGALFMLGSASAGSLGSARVTAITLRTSSADALVTLSAELSGGPTCPGPLAGNQVAFDHTSAGGKSILSLVTSAYLSGKAVSVTGNDTCVPGASEGVFVEGLASISLN